jgi:cation diffusion facilitator CzcD-associated flavoprotein CzcO
MINTDVIIIGAGQAGMAAAHSLMERGHENIHVVEATSHVGGR